MFAIKEEAVNFVGNVIGFYDEFFPFLVILNAEFLAFGIVGAGGLMVYAVFPARDDAVFGFLKETNQPLVVWQFL